MFSKPIEPMNAYIVKAGNYVDCAESPVPTVKTAYQDIFIFSSEIIIWIIL